MSFAATSSQPVDAEVARGVVDCDVHPMITGGLETLSTYMPRAWARRMGLGEKAGRGRLSSRAIQLPATTMYRNSAGNRREDAMSEEMLPCSDPAFVASHLLDTHSISRAVLITQEMLGLGALPDGDAAAVLASAHNEWLVDRWLSFDKRYRGALAVAPQIPELAAKEIHRLGQNQSFVSVFVPLYYLALGERHYYPIYEAARDHGLPIMVHPSGTENEYSRAPRMAVSPTYYLEWHAGLAQVHQSNTLSLLCHGVFESYPELKVLIAEGGFAWAADLMWRLDRNWKALRDEVPWVRRPPSEYLFDHIRFTSQPFIEPPKREFVAVVMEMIQADRTLLFSSDYPHWDFDDPHRALRDVDKTLQQRVRVDNPREFFGDRLGFR
jgi:predicted TIM-barrel fold metal-dependent hydrolase